MPDLVIVLVIVLVVVLIWRGPKTLPSLGRAFGQGVKEARKEIDGIKTDKDGEPAPVIEVTTASAPVTQAAPAVQESQPLPPPAPPAPPAAPPAPPAAPPAPPAS